MDIKKKLENWIEETLGLESVSLEHPTDLERGDFALVLPPLNVRGGEGVIEKLNENKLPEVEKLELANGRFINFFLTKEFFANSIKEISEKGSEFGKTEFLKEQKIFIEHTQPNPFKEFHIGHLMNNVIGESIARIMKANGAEIETASYHGDVGLQIAKAVWAKKNNPELSLGEAYAEGSNKYEENKDEIVLINKKIYDRSDEEINEIYNEGRKESLDQFESLYKRLDSKFNFHFYESESGETGKKLVLENVGKVFEESEGAIIFRGENFEPKTHTRVFLNKESLPTYEAKELGLAKIKREKWPDYDKSITVTGNEQGSFFNVVEVAIGEVFPELKTKLTHLSHGMLKLPSGKMSSRTGDIITTESLIDQVKEKILQKIDDPSINSGQADKIAEEIAIGAIKYTILRQAIGGDIVFDFDKSVSFEGDSGPYLQYTAVRANSVLSKADNVSRTVLDTTEVKPPENWETTELERVLYKFSEVVEIAGKEYAPHKILSYLLDLASKFNSFYANHKIIDPSDEASPYKLSLTSAVATVLKNGLYLLGIKVPERM